MANEIQCPVCGIQNISAEKENCPQCDADLSCYKVLERIPDNYSAETFSNKWFRSIPILVTIGIVLVLIVSLLTGITLMQQKKGSSLAPEIERKLKALDHSLNNIEDKISSLEKASTKPVKGSEQGQEKYSPNITKLKKMINSMIEARNKTTAQNKFRQDIKTTSLDKDENGTRMAKRQTQKPESREHESENKGKPKDRTGVREPGDEKDNLITYTCTDKDTLWELAERYYGNGTLYPAILEYNPGISIYDIKKGLKLKIIDDQRQALKLFKKIVCRKNDQLYWKYTIQSDDSFESIAKKYCRTEKCLKRMKEINPDQSLKTGETIKIPVY